MAIASAKTNAVIMDIRILAAAEGFLPTAFTAAKPTMAITAAGPKVAKTMIKIIVRLRI